ncbi:MAG: ADP-ribosylglycohydrolase family protein [Rhodoplanes sp.]
MIEPSLSGRLLFGRLLAEGRLRMCLSPLFDEPAPHKGHIVAPDRVRGMLIGLAIGDALGNASEGMNPAERRRRHGEIRDYLPNWYADGRCVGLPSDDTQLAFWTLEHLLENEGRLVPELLAQKFTQRQIFGIGQTVKAFCRARAAGAIWYDAAVASAGNGALMRIAPILLPHLRDGGPDLWVDAAIAGAVTHNDHASIAACVAFTGMLSALLVADATPAPNWWIDEYVRLAEPIERGARYLSRGGDFAEFEGTVSGFVAQHIPAALQSEDSLVSLCNRWHSGAYLLETVPSVILTLGRYGADPEEAILRAVNDTHDNDTAAAIVGTAVGALHGEKALPARWRAALLGRTGTSDDGRVQALLELAVERFAA